MLRKYMRISQNEVRKQTYHLVSSDANINCTHIYIYFLFKQFTNV